MMSDLAHNSDIQIGTVSLNSPIFFPSVSTVKTALSPVDYVRMLNALNGLNGQYLISAFDLIMMNSPEQEAIIEDLYAGMKEGAIVLMDSGNYESYWKNAQSEWSQEHFHEALDRFPCNLAFGFDEQNPPEDIDLHIRLVCERYSKDQEAATTTKIIPIVHGQRDILPSICSSVAMETGVDMLAVPERRLGDSVFDRAMAVTAIRKSLDETGRHVALHLLGTGNPVTSNAKLSHLNG